MMDRLFTLLRCTISGERLRLMEPDEVATLNARIERGQARRRGGDRAPEAVDGALVAEPSGLIYAIRRDLPYLLPEDAIEITPS